MGISEEIQARFDEFIALIKAGEFAKACEMYAEDATLGGGGSDLLEGRASLLS